MNEPKVKEDVKNIKEKYKAFLKSNNSYWEFGNEILYKMCEENPEHDDKSTIIGKIWLIGRSYAAAIERRKLHNEKKGDDFYFDIVGQKIWDKRKKLDEKINYLKNSEKDIEDDIDYILETHKFLVEIFKEMTGLEKRSLASKYLHFHCKDKFFIFDSRAQTAIRKIVKNPDKDEDLLKRKSSYDPEYVDFAYRMLGLRKFIKISCDVEDVTPRDLDTFLLSLDKLCDK